MTAQDSYLAHIVARIDADVQFLVEQGALSQADAHDISAKLNGNTNATIHGLPPPPARSTGPAASVTSGFSSVAAAFKRTVAPPPAPTPAATPLSMPTPTTPAAPPRSSGPVILRALWDWDDENDLSFKTGDRIELTEETSPEWWTGRMGARTGLFPSNYVERIEPAVHVNHRASAHMAPSATYKASNLNSYNHSSSSHSATSSIGLTQPAVDEPKKSKYDGLKKTMANSAAGGVGFGAGAAIGGGLVRAIF